ncbi:MAG TPA: hypothetical protein VMT35_07590, partial [Ignavibacteriaceae bacterium]|nr:hypothetical protein [Ignavibacteriaceae bacterium]
MILKKIQPVFYIIISAAVIILVQSCNLLSEPEPYENRDAHSPTIEYKTAILSNFSKDQIVTGIIDLQFIPDFVEMVDSITAFVDSVKGSQYINFTNLPQRSYQIRIDTKGYNNGNHDLIFCVFKKPAIADSLGLLSLLTDAFYIYKTSLIFDNTPAAAPTNILVTLQNKNARISWDTTNFYFFHSYTIKKNGNLIAE